MKAKWNVTKLIATGSLAVLAVVLALAGAGIAAVTGVPGTSGFLTVLTTPATIMLCCFVVEAFGAVAIMGIVHGLLEIPLPLTGAPGFLFKVPILVVGGLIVDVLYLLLKRNKLIASLVTGGIYILYSGLSVIWVGRLVGMPGVEEAADFLLSPLMLVLSFVGGAIGGFLGWLIYSRIKDTAVVVRIRGE